MDRTGHGVSFAMKTLCRGLSAAGLLLTLLAASAGAQPFDIFPPDKLVAGMKGYGVTDMGDGKGIQKFEVEIIGLLKRYAPGQDLILARVNGIGLEKAGIIAGMSGSPVYVDGKLVGALAYGWPFSKDPICGITPIQSMLDIRHVPAAAPVPIARSAVATASLVSAFKAGSFTEPFAELIKPFAPSAADSMAALPLPVSYGGLSSPGKLFNRIAEAANWMAVPSGAASSATATPSKTA